MSNNGEKRAMHEAVYSALLDDPGHRHASCDEHAIYGDPQVVDADGPDDTFGTLDDNLGLQLISPAIDAGDNTAGLDGTGPATTTIADVATDLKDIPAAWTYKHPRHR